jgi:hypothetical protein
LDEIHEAYGELLCRIVRKRMRSWSGPSLFVVKEA